MAYASNRELFPVWHEPRSFWERSGLTPRQQRILDYVLAGAVALLLAGWVYSVAAALRAGQSPRVARRIATTPTPFSPNGTPDAAFLLDAALRRFVGLQEFRGRSGAVSVVVEKPGQSLELPDSLPEGLKVGYAPAGGSDTVLRPPGGAPPRQPGVWQLVLGLGELARVVPGLTVITEVPTSRIEHGQIGAYHLGTWPSRGGIYTPPPGLVRVTPQNMDTYVSEHIQLKDFLTKGQSGVWPKYVVLSPKLLDKLELTFQELEREGHPVRHVFVISGFRTPYYNANGGDVSGRGELSRHMYGDAMDVTIDNDRNGLMDDLNGDGKVGVQDARILARAAQKVEQRYPELVGGIGVYRPTGAHHGFVHIDTRGYRARWGAW